MIETSRVQFGTTAIPYSIRRTARIKTVALVVQANGTLLVRAPNGVSVHRLDGIVHDKAAWVVRRARRVSDLPPPLPKREFVAGETIRYLGRQYRLRIVRSGPALRFRGTTCEIRAATRETFSSALQARANVYVPRRLGHLCRKLKLKAPDVVVREQRKRWGSCTTHGVVRVNWRIIQAPVALIDYVLVHELAHLEHRNHDHAFWRQVARWLPDYESRRARLRDLGPTLIW